MQLSHRFSLRHAPLIAIAVLSVAATAAGVLWAERRGDVAGLRATSLVAELTRAEAVRSDLLEAFRLRTEMLRRSSWELQSAHAAALKRARLDLERIDPAKGNAARIAATRQAVSAYERAFAEASAAHAALGDNRSVGLEQVYLDSGVGLERAVAVPRSRLLNGALAEVRRHEQAFLLRGVGNDLDLWRKGLARLKALSQDVAMRPNERAAIADRIADYDAAFSALHHTRAARMAAILESDARAIEALAPMDGLVSEALTEAEAAQVTAADRRAATAFLVAAFLATGTLIIGAAALFLSRRLATPADLAE